MELIDPIHQIDQQEYSTQTADNAKTVEKINKPTGNLAKVASRIALAISLVLGTAGHISGCTPTKNKARFSVMVPETDEYHLVRRVLLERKEERRDFPICPSNEKITVDITLENLPVGECRAFTRICVLGNRYSTYVACRD